MKLTPDKGAPVDGDRHSEYPTHRRHWHQCRRGPHRRRVGARGRGRIGLVEISPNSEPPVCKILDFGKYKYQAQKKAAEARKKQRTVAESKKSGGGRTSTFTTTR